ncbi:MAG TPA: glycosyltransferase family 39 protein [Anaerolineales bacterium]|nr:glycosyltransferase family 39 protein [Anaerolineales bacterium]
MDPSITIRGWKAFLSWEKAAAALLILLGALLRLRQYLTGRSLWADEAMLALNIVDRNFAGMFQPLDYDQGAPIGFLLVEKLFNSILGKHEFALRLFPLLVGWISLWLFYLLLRRITSGAGLLIALALFAFNPRLVYYSSEVKQYILDVAVTILLLLIAVPLFNNSPRKKDYAWLLLAGLIALWFSHPALFVLAGIGLAFVIITLQRRDYSSLRLVIGMGILWVLNIAFLYLLILKDLSQNTYMREYWQGAFLPMPPWSDADAGWFIKSLNENIGIQFGVPYAIFVVFFLMLVGWVMLWFHQRGVAIAIACIALVTLTTSALGLYPVFERMILFLVPIGLILAGKAVEAIYQRVQRFQLLGMFSVMFLAGYLLYGPFVTSVQNFLAPKYFEHIRPTMETLRDAWKDGDTLYVSHGALPAFRFYAPFYRLENIPYEFGEREDYQNPQNILNRLESFKGQPRAWILFSHVYEKVGFNERDFILNYLDQGGQKKREFRVPGTSVFLYLYDLED